ncbi:MAG: hypothetical protein HQ518_29765 [Rhodopirellula sp.]|nr:hypothetical protein [Rhodopirellula sp.]
MHTSDSNGVANSRWPDALEELAMSVRTNGFDAYGYHPDTILCSAQVSNNAGDCFQVGQFTDLKGQCSWLLFTWPPVYYLVPPEIDVLDVCLAVLRMGRYGGKVFPDSIVDQFQLVRMSNKEFNDAFGFD